MKDDWFPLKARFIIPLKVGIHRFLAYFYPHFSIFLTVISSTLQAQNTSFLALAARTAEVDTELQELKNQYRELWKAQTGSARDPFNELDRRPGDSEGLLNGMGNFSLNR